MSTLSKYARVAILTLACIGASACNEEEIAAAKKKAEVAQAAADQANNELRQLQSQSQTKINDLQTQLQNEQKKVADLTTKSAANEKALADATSKLAKIDQDKAAADAAAKALPTTPLEKSVVLVKQGKDADAITEMLAFQKTLSRTGMTYDPTWANSNHILAVSYFKLGQMEKAKEPMESVYRSGKSNRSIVINMGILDITNKATIVRGLKSLRPFIQSHMEDEQAINLFGQAIDVAVREFPNVNFNEYIADYQKANKVLEASKPGMKRWGVDWISGAEFAKLEDTRKKAQVAVDSEKPEVDLLTPRVQQAQSDVNNYSRGIMGGTPAQISNRNSQLKDAQQDLARYQSMLSQAQARLDRAMESLPRPNWGAKLVPVEIELLPK
jgi:DNA repair exonuclease SbcCD ATPase subunit